MKEDNSLKDKKYKFLHGGEVMQNILEQWKQQLYVMYTMSSGTLLKSEISLVHEEIYKETLEVLNEDIKHLILTINYFNNFFNQEKIKKKFNLKNCITNTLTLFQPILIKHHIILRTKFLDEIEIEGIEIEFMQVILNILNNVIYFLSKNRDINERCILITSKKTINNIEISIKENGGKISSLELNRIFDEYCTLKLNDMDIGVGLAMSKKIIEEDFCGSIRIYNDKFHIHNQKYCGANFVITLNKL